MFALTNEVSLLWSVMSALFESGTKLFEPTSRPQIPTASLKPNLSSLRCFV